MSLSTLFWNFGGSIFVVAVGAFFAFARHAPFAKNAPDDPEAAREYLAGRLHERRSQGITMIMIGVIQMGFALLKTFDV